MSSEYESDEDIFVKPEVEKTTKGKPRQRKPREMSEETKQRMLDILAKGREKKLEKSRLKRETLEENKKEIRETIKSKVREVRNQLKKELIDEGISKKKMQYEKQDKDVRSQSAIVKDVRSQSAIDKDVRSQSPIKKTADQPTAIDTHMVKPEPKPTVHIVEPEPPKKQITVIDPEPPKKEVKPIPTVKSTQIATPPQKPVNLTAEYMRKLRSIYNF